VAKLNPIPKGVKKIETSAFLERLYRREKKSFRETCFFANKTPGLLLLSA